MSVEQAAVIEPVRPAPPALAGAPFKRRRPITRQFELVERVAAYTPDVDEKLLDRAFVYAMRAHRGQVRESGDPYFSHPLEVAAIVTDMRLDQKAVAAALLHDTVEDTAATGDEIRRLFGAEIAQLVEGLTKLKQIDLVSKQSRQGENLRRLLLAVSKDVRVLLIKLADRLHNMRTLDFTKEEKRARVAQETMDIHAPLAGRMGMQDMRDELEQLAFQHLHPDAFETISARLDDLGRTNSDLIQSIETSLRDTLLAQGIRATVQGRRKKPYSVFRKMAKNRVSFEQLSDIYGFRVIVEKVAECYAALGHVHMAYAFVPDRFKDYISNPKQNDYRSLHTTVVGPSLQRVEMQIRTREMHEVAEYGIAAHALYKDGFYEAQAVDLPGSKLSDGADAQVSRAYAWLRRTVEGLAAGEHPEDVLEQARLDLFTDQVFCFTPKGRLIALPQGATPIDFAYAIHSDIGDGCAGARVNGQSMPVVTQLANGDEVEIEVDPDHVPPPVWESVVVTGRARAGIRRAGRHKAIEQYAELGEAILERAFSRADLTFRKQDLERVLSKIGRTTLGDALASVGRGEIAAEDVLRAVRPDYQPDRSPTPRPSEEEGWFNLAAIRSVAFRVPGLRRASERDLARDVPELPVRGVTGEVAVRFDPGGGAVPGDRIVGIATKGERTNFRGITIYAIQSTGLQRFEDRSEGWLDLRWDVDGDAPQRFPARIRVAMANKPGTLAQVTGVFGETNVNIAELYLGSPERDLAVIEFGVEVWDLKHLSRLMTQLRALACVTTVDRVWERDAREPDRAMNL